MFIDQLRSIRGTLSEILNSDQQFHMKLVGPQPEATGTDAKLEPRETVAVIIEDIRNLSDRLYKAAGTRHEVIGEFQPTSQVAGRARA